MQLFCGTMSFPGRKGDLGENHGLWSQTDLLSGLGADTYWSDDQRQLNAPLSLKSLIFKGRK